MKAKDIMTSPVISVAPEATVSEIAALLLARRISAAPVVENGRLGRKPRSEPAISARNHLRAALS